MKRSWRPMLAGGIALLVLGAVYYHYSRPTVIPEEEVPLGAVYRLDARSLASVKAIQDFEAWCQAHGTFEAGRETEALNDLTMALIRHKRYGDGLSGVQASLWRKMAGPVPRLTLDDEAPLPGFREKLTALSGFRDPVTEKDIDFTHMIAVADVYYTDLERSDEEEVYYDLLLSAGGDLETFLIDAAKYKAKTGTADSDSLYDYSKKTIGSTQKSYFDGADFLADLDGQNLAVLMEEEGLLLSEALLQYYQGGGAADRQSRFMAYHGGAEAFRQRMESFMNARPMEEARSDGEMVEFMEGFRAVKAMMIVSLNGDISNLTEGDRGAVTRAFSELVQQGY